ncbi:MAG: Na+/H+ antiporter [Chitinophagaceae bacterium]|nr:MAG: Na+/H+ antiporter [Chitinophagaceae bacterium]
MHIPFLPYIALIGIILALVMLATRVRLAYPIVLVLGGLAISFTSAFSDISISPDLVFLIFLPPLLYEAAWQVSWKEFWKWRRVIFSFAFPIVILTSCVVAFVANALIPGFTLALGFLLGGIVSPPDAISATTIMRKVNVPKVLVSIAEGESLLNDASSLIVFRFALAAVLTGHFSLSAATGSFFLVIILGVAIGLGVGLIFYAIHRWLPTTASIETVLTLLTPYCMYYAAEYFHFSGVLAVVSGGLFLSGKRATLLTYESRIQGVNVWNSLVFILNGLVFLLIGLQLPVITKELGTISLGTAIGYGLIISLVLIVARMACAMGASLFTRMMSRFITVAEANPGWRAPAVLGWAGMRGVVSLAAALSIPLLSETGEAFPQRNLILFITFIVILVTLVLQGLSLPWLIRKLKPEDRSLAISETEQERIIQMKLAKYSIQYLEEQPDASLRSNPYVRNLMERLRHDLRLFGQEQSREANEHLLPLASFQQTYLGLLEEQRRLLKKMNSHSEFDEELIRKYLGLIDLEELKLHGKLIEV